MKENIDSNSLLEAVRHNIRIYNKLFIIIKRVAPVIIISFNPELASVCKLRFPRIKVIGSLRGNPYVDSLKKKNKIYASGIISTIYFVNLSFKILLKSLINNIEVLN